MKPFFSFQKLALISGNCIIFQKERIKSSVTIEMFKTENHCKTPQVVMQLMAHGIPENED